MALDYFTLIHVVLSLVGIAAGFVVIGGMLLGKVLPLWTVTFLITTLLTSITGFFFPFHGVTPGIILGVISVIVLAPASFAYLRRSRSLLWLRVFAIGSVVGLYLNSFVLLVQLFQKVPAMAALAPNQGGPVFAVTQGLLLIGFVAMGYLAVKPLRVA